MFRWITPARAGLAAALLVAAGAGYWLLGGFPPAPADPPASPAPTPGVPWFADETAAAGIDFVHHDSATPAHYIHEVMGSGVAWIDYDADGRPDLFFVQGGPVRPGPGPHPTNKLYRNLGGGRFADVTEAAGLARTGFGMGAAVGDTDNDGFDDLLVTYFGGVVLYHNEPAPGGGRRFADVTEAAGLKDPHWATSAAWADIDGDGLLDLYVCNYCEVDLANYPACTDPKSGEPMCCPPSHFPATRHRLFRNLGGGRFEDATGPSGLAEVPPAPGLGVVAVDLDGDGRIDLYVANDMKPAYLLHNRGGGRVADVALAAGVALGLDGTLVAGMGVAAGDVDGSGRPSLFVTNFERRPSVLYLNRGGLRFREAGMPSGLAGPALTRLGFGAAFLDADLDGSLDAATANGHIHRSAAKVANSRYPQSAQLFAGDGRGKFRDVSAAAGPYFAEARVGRGLAVADYDDDGRPDLAFSNSGGPPALLHNLTPTDHGWVRLELVGDGVKSNRNAVGARVEVEAGGVKQVRWVTGGGSYLSASDRRLSVGLGTAEKVDRVTVTWPSGRRDEYRDLPGRRAYRLAEGRPTPEPR
ncbi:MAG: CRTAC1 family protein [Gemmataceae bacterium]|nr:CRTAC1 family protein [Gemmataceae bacterium]